jgi:hypothetical protein
MSAARTFAAGSAVLLLVAACSGSGGTVDTPADLAGAYTISVTNTDNGCSYDNWKVGQSAQNIQLDITQTHADVSASLRGLGSIAFAVLGIGAMSGTVSGSSATVTAVGTNGVRRGQCAFFVRATASITLTGNTINGTVTYTNETNHHAECGVLETCSSQQTLAGNRPPK